MRLLAVLLSPTLAVSPQRLGCTGAEVGRRCGEEDRLGVFAPRTRPGTTLGERGLRSNLGRHRPADFGRSRRRLCIREKVQQRCQVLLRLKERPAVSEHSPLPRPPQRLGRRRARRPSGQRQYRLWVTERVVKEK